MASSSPYLKASEVAEMLGMDISSIYKLCDRKVIPSIRIGEKARRIPRAALEAYLARQAGVESPGLALLKEAHPVDEDPVHALERQAVAFAEHAGCSAHEYVDRWRAQKIEDTAESAALLIEAISLREALDRAGIGDRVLA